MGKLYQLEGRWGFKSLKLLASATRHDVTRPQTSAAASPTTGQIIVKRILTWAHVKPCEKNTNEEDFKVKDFSTQHLSLTPLFDVLCQKGSVRAGAISAISPPSIFKRNPIAPFSIFHKLSGK